MEEPTQKTKKPQTSTLIDARLRKLRDLQELGVSPYSTGFVPDTSAEDFKKSFDDYKEAEPLDATVRMAGRIMFFRAMGKASFVKLRDASGDFQAYLSRESLGEGSYGLLKKLDVGDIIGVEGKPFRTRTGELSLLTHHFKLLTKSIRPLPEKWHGLSDVETRYRQRYVDLIVNPEVGEIVRKRSRIISQLRDFLTGRGFTEVETPMMQAIPGGATAKPFETYHHSLDRRLFLRIAPELYLKRLLVGGFEKV
ncbi:MAG: amino acid--tRNA ligase-related protein, partial [Pseudomonadota bacterium]